MTEEGLKGMTTREEAENEKEALGEELIFAWVRLTALLKNNRITDGLMYNEAIVMLLVYNEYRKGADGLAFSEIVAQTRMLKSLANRTVTALESKGLVERTGGARDKRAVFVRLVPERADEFLKVHRRSLALAEKVCDVIGREDAEAFVRLTGKIAACGISSERKPGTKNKKEERN